MGGCMKCKNAGLAVLAAKTGRTWPGTGSREAQLTHTAIHPLSMKIKAESLLSLADRIRLFETGHYSLGSYLGWFTRGSASNTQ